MQAVADADETIGLSHSEIVADHAAISEVRALAQRIASLAAAADVHRQLQTVVQSNFQTLQEGAMRSTGVLLTR